MAPVILSRRRQDRGFDARRLEVQVLTDSGVCLKRKNPSSIAASFSRRRLANRKSPLIHEAQSSESVRDQIIAPDRAQWLSRRNRLATETEFRGA